MTGNLCRITVRNAMFGGGFFEILTVTGYDAVWEPEAPAKRDVLRPVAPEEPDTDIEVGYSKSIREPLTLPMPPSVETERSIEPPTLC